MSVPYAKQSRLRNRVRGIEYHIQRGCLCGSWKPSFLPLNWRAFSRRVTARW